MGYCHKCEHDCSEKDPCPCCRTKNKDKFIPWNPSPYIYTEPIYPKDPYRKPLRPLREYWCHPDISTPKRIK